MAKVTIAIETSKGNINLKLYADETPLTSANFINLALRGYYDGLTFHRVIDDFMIQGGCPNGNGMGGPGYDFEDECLPELEHNSGGILSMANAGPNTNGSQFFITHGPTTWLDGKHTVFGKIVSHKDMDVVNSISQGDVIKSITVDGDYEEVVKRVLPQVDFWNDILDDSFPKLKKLPF